jgi:hypothetical protein
VNGDQPSAKDVVSVAIDLKSLPENNVIPLEELLAAACRLLLEAGDIIETEWIKYNLRRNEIRGRRVQHLSDPEAAVLVVVKEKDLDRRLERFVEFKEFMRNPVELTGDLYLEYLRRTHLADIQSGNWTYGLCQDLKDYFPKWQTIKASRAQKKG